MKEDILDRRSESDRPRSGARVLDGNGLPLMSKDGSFVLVPELRDGDEIEYEVGGPDMQDYIAARVELREAMGPSVNVIVDTVKDALDETPPELVADLMEVGVCLAGGGAKIQGLAERIEDAIKMRVWIAEDSMTCVARGAGKVLEDLDNYDRVLVGLDRGSTHH